MRIIGLNHDMYISSACLVEDGVIVGAAAEERFDRDKRTRAFPTRAVAFCLKRAGLGATAVDHWVQSWNPGVYFCKFNPLFSKHRRQMAEHLYAVPDHIMAFYGRPEADWISQEIGGSGAKVHYVTHHRAHAANAFFLSDFPSAAILTADAQGEMECTTLCRGEGGRITVLESLRYPRSLGMVYATLTQYLGFRANSDEWKVMALASYAVGDGRYREAFSRLIRTTSDGLYDIDLNYFSGFLHEQPDLFPPALEALLGPRRHPDDPLIERHYQVAAALQQAVEEAVTALLRRLHRATGEKNLALGGGLFMNSVLNGKVLEQTPFERLFLSSCPDDSGNSLGAALYLHNHILGGNRVPAPAHAFSGPAFANAEVEAVLQRFGLAFTKPEALCEAVAELLAQGLIVGWFQGPMEFGQRALGGRSILADPRRPDMRDRVNQAVKFREPFRPFAPAVLAERQAEIFQMGKAGDVPFMEKVYHVRPEYARRIPAVVHVDGSCRLQTVRRDVSPRFHRLIEAFEERTKVPVLLNTSFNRNGEPIVCTPEDALQTFFGCGLDALAIEDYLLLKRQKDVL